VTRNRTLASALVAGVMMLAATSARSAVIYELVPSASVGVTSNALMTSVPIRDEFGVLAADGRVRFEGAQSVFGLGYTLGFTHYFEGHGIDTLSNALNVSETIHPSARLDLHFAGSSVLSRTSRIDIGDVTAVMPLGTPAGSYRYLGTTVLEDLTYRPTARYAYGQLLSYNRLDYIDHVGLADTQSIAAAVHGDVIGARDTLTLTFTFTDFFIGETAGATSMVTTGESQTLLGDLRLRWHRLLSPSWESDLEAGVAASYHSGNGVVPAPVGLAAVGYRRDFWFATLTVSQTDLPNPFLGALTIDDQALLRLAIPLTRRELVTLGGFASYLYARAGDETSFARLYDQRAAGVVLSAHFARLPFWGAIEYTYLDQHGGQGASDITRHLVLLSIGGAFSWGPGTPRFFHGGL